MAVVVMQDAAVPVAGLHGDENARTHVPIPVLPPLMTRKESDGPLPIPGHLRHLKSRTSPIPVLQPQKGRGIPALIPRHLTQIRRRAHSPDLLAARQCGLVLIPDRHLCELRINDEPPVIINQ